MNEDLVIQKIINLEEGVVEVKEKVKKLDEWDTLMSGQDKIIKLLETIRIEDAAAKSKTDRLEKRIDEFAILSTLSSS
ncbi:MAG: hypothetical protein A2921_03425 [Candidatus Magasanikbacteria bacterium RIFCSPLOWO2_01_FULL_43_20b]|uniref:Uncharacterized protein n=1 Tax=Candidatus Magasanikbacteria bacterium RIFCSPLOWO2_12_FULL_43_12 TaxID=1798692 RepID=A0A1F6MQM9_9BACT|nr:MAG: hypothetical protein A3C74_02240 [Candidatus Magasanikbacteria bacterium RIFCSPHIGHO2_02_FULL_44_13]OGH71963.1 MAG: hypothetical protein A3I93_03010 [Candidatus Magasanikbacteria bacterium RIFCSPLOWO2_02_FULL_43_22]OGH73141.1 MAG: hypothetical protein A2921_03425 [Candidatus Magasanikbacteria bacterium RIFCSPLOWO2_01_FULL_43_20b]OGH73966.1 MAG: hypothetical protein A3G00_03615 [Candidatus Magasanikbacteria bacterium RIFCSPLOWO2_12_FULL_43_12]